MKKGAGQLAWADVVLSFIRHLPGEGVTDDKIKDRTCGELGQPDRKPIDVEGVPRRSKNTSASHQPS